MILRRQLLRAQSISLDDLLRKRPRFKKAVGVERDLCDTNILRYHHGHRPEQGLQIIRQDRPSRVARVLSNEDVSSQFQGDHDSVEHELFQAKILCALNLKNLLCDD